MNFPTMWVSLL